MIKTKYSGRKIDYSSMTRLPNVDTMCDVLVTTQKEMNQTPSMQEAEYDKLGKKVRRFKRTSDNKVIDTRTGEIIEPGEERDFPIVPRTSEHLTQRVRVMKSESTCESCPVKEKQQKEKKRLKLFERGFANFYNGVFDEDDEDDNDEYICEYCTELGYGSKYKAYLCDNCTKCETCSEFSNGTCDGCSYSRTRTGRLYSESLSLDQIVDADDLEIINTREENENERRKFGGFSILDY